MINVLLFILTPKLKRQNHAGLFKFREIMMVSPFQDVCLCHKTTIKLFLLINSIHLIRYFKNYSKAVLPVPVKRSMN